MAFKIKNFLLMRFSVEYILLLVIIIFLNQLNSFPADSLTTQNQVKVFNVADPNEILLKYQSSLLEESRLHREYLEKYNERIFFLIGALGTVILGILTFFNIRSRKDIRNMVEDSFKANIDMIIKEGRVNIDLIIKENLKEFDTLINDVKNKEKFVNTLLLDLSAKMSPEASESKPADLRRLKNKLILWIDDNIENHEYPISLLKEAGTIIKEFTSSDSGLEYILSSQKECDLIISNMGRGGNEKEGLDFIKELKKNKISVPIIIFTRPSSMRKYNQAVIEAGAKKCVTGYAQLLSQIQKLLGV